MPKIKSQERLVNEDQSSEGRAHCRNVIRIDGKTEKLIDAQEKVRSLSKLSDQEIDGVDHLM
jgi:hypothetical protein